jgi:hypothetical protein
MRNRLTIVAILVCLTVLLSFLPGIVVVLGEQMADYHLYLPLVMKQETPTPTQTPTPTVPPVPTVTTIPPGVHILQNYSHYVDSIDYLHIVGEVLNNTSDHLWSVKITVNIFNGGGQLVDVDYSYMYLSNLPAWDKTCFEVLLQEPTDWAYYQFEQPTYWTDGTPLPNMTVYNDSGSYDPTYGWYEIIGLVRNDHGSRVEYVSPVGTLYNASGAVVGCDFTYVSSTHLDPDQTSSFKLTFFGRDYSGVTLYRLQVDGYP